MCFSATASFLASGSIGGIGIASVKSVRRLRELPLAAVPLIFAFQQAMEGIVWLSVRDPSVSLFATKSDLFFTYAFWPAFLPWAVYLIEPSKPRKNILIPFMALGWLIGLYGLITALFSVTSATVFHGNLVYDVPVFYPIYGTLYVLVVSASCLVSSAKWITILGSAIVISFIASLLISFEAVASVWCYFAAILSVFVLFHFRSSLFPFSGAVHPVQARKSR